MTVGEAIKELMKLPTLFNIDDVVHDRDTASFMCINIQVPGTVDDLIVDKEFTTMLHLEEGDTIRTETITPKAKLINIKSAKN